MVAHNGHFKIFWFIYYKYGEGSDFASVCLKIVDVTSAYRAHKLVQGKEMIWKNVGIRHATYPIDVSQTR